MSALTASPPVCDIAERPHGRRRKKVLPLLVTMNRSNRQPGSTRAPAGSPPPVRHPSSGYAPPFRRIPDFGLSPAPVCSRLPPARFAPPRLPSRFRHGTARPSCPHQAAACPFPSGTVRMPPLSACGSRSRPPRFIDGPAATPSFFCSGRREGNISVVPDGGLLYSPLLSID